MAVEEFDGFTAPCNIEDSALPVSDALGGIIDLAGQLLPGAGVPFNPQFPQLNSKIASDPAFKLDFPAGMKMPSMDIPEATNIMSFLSPLLSVISTVMMIFGPVKVIIDIIIAIINVICAMPDIGKMIEAIIKLFPPLLALLSLFPIAAGLLILLQIVKTVIMIIMAILLILVPKIELLLKNAQSILGFGGEEAKAGALQKICGLVQDMLNDLGILSPINSILQLVQSLIGAATNGMCGINLGGEDDDCCNDCPKIIRNPPTSPRGSSITSIDETEENFELTITNALFSQNPIGAPDIATIGDSIPISRSMESIWQTPFPSEASPLGSVLFDIKTFLPGGFVAALDVGYNVISFYQRPAANEFVLEFQSAHHLEAGDSIFIQNSPAGKFDGEFKVNSIIGAPSGSRRIKIVSKELFDMYLDPQTGLQTLQEETISASASAATEVLPIFQIQSAALSLDGQSLILSLRNDIFSTISQFGAIGRQRKYYLLAREPKAFELGGIGSGCSSKIAAKRREFSERMMVGSDAALANGATTPQSPYIGDPEQLLGVPIPTIDIDRLKEDLLSYLETPFAEIKIVDHLYEEMEKFTDLGARILCVIVDPVNSIFSSSVGTADIGGTSKVTLSFQPRDNGPNGGKPILEGIPSNIQINSLFTTTHGTLSEVRFDAATGTYSADLTATAAGNAEVKVYFITNEACSTATVSNNQGGFVQKKLSVKFIDSSLRIRRQERQYLPSAGGRRR